MIVSPEWFHEPRATDAQYAGNFSIEHVLATLTSPSLDPAIKRRLAKRMADYPETLAKSPILEQLVSALEEDTPAAATALRIATIFSASYEHILNLSDPLFTWIEFMITRRHSRPMNPPMTASGIDWKSPP